MRKFESREVQIAAGKEYASKRYQHHVGWQVIVECYDDDDISKELDQEQDRVGKTITTCRQAIGVLIETAKIERELYPLKF